MYDPLPIDIRGRGVIFKRTLSRAIIACVTQLFADGISCYRVSFISTIGNNDFVPLPPTTLFVNGAITGEECSTITILDDSIVERDENFIVLLTSFNTAVDIIQTSSMVTIIDNDMVVVGWSSVTYMFGEEADSATICAEIMDGEIDRPVTVVYSTMDDTAHSNTLFLYHTDKLIFL